ncbi:MAG: DNA polymerase III subunit alpha [Fibrobacteria bacterium]|nr:DNA polymerase III subunit alpha [Fibrobacteria bacterium]
MPGDFVHLQVQSEFSMLQSMVRISELLSRAAELGQTAIALTDKGNMFGALEFYKTAKETGLSPIIGCNLNIHPITITKKQYSGEQPDFFNLSLLARDNTGYKNLMDICSSGYLNMKNDTPLVDIHTLEKSKGGLICLAGNYQGEPGHLLLNGKKDLAEELLLRYAELFSLDNLYLCLQDHGLPEEKKLNEQYLLLHQEHGYKLVAVNDVRYVNREDSQIHDALTCIAGNYKVNDKTRPRLSSDRYYLRTTEDMKDLFGRFPGALENTVSIAESCNAEIEFGKLYWPSFPIPPEFADNDSYLAHLSYAGAREKYPELSPEIEARLQSELAIMKQMNVAGYMLIVWDFIAVARKMNIPVGPGRGSAVGSLVSYCLEITDVEPLRFNLLFERFLNPERKSMPDIDTDFSDLDRGRIIEYVVQKYGKESVAQMVTYGRMKARMVIRDVGRVLGFPADFMNRLCKTMPGDSDISNLGKKRKAKKLPKLSGLQAALELSPEFSKALDQNPDLQRLKEISLKLEGLTRQAGMHAAAVIIAPTPLVNFAPLFRQPASDQVMIQYDKKHAESVGLLKMDFLGLRTLSVIQNCLEQVKQNFGKALDLRTLEETDEKTLALLGRGETVGVFQFESDGMQDYLRKLMPTGLEDLIAMNALYRPGPIKMIPTYIARKNGAEPIDYYHADFKPVLEDTYGVIVYQEQVMLLAQLLAGFSLGAADNLRRAMSKKDLGKMESLRPMFINGAVERGYPEALAVSLWNDLVPFSEYAFNKSHAAAYATIAFQTAYLKTHYPAAFMAAIMTSEIDKTDRLVILLDDCRKSGITVLGPDVNQSYAGFQSNKDVIHYGLAGIKNVGKSAAKKIREEYEHNGTFRSVEDFCDRLTSNISRKAFESLIMAGALDSLPGNRASQLAALEPALLNSARKQREIEMGQISLFEKGSPGDETDTANPSPVEAWGFIEMLGKEKKVMGLYFSGHPLDEYKMEMQAFAKPLPDAESHNEMNFQQSITLGGIISRIKPGISKKDSRQFAQCVLEGYTAKPEIMFWPDMYETYREYLEPDARLLIHCELRIDRFDPGKFRITGKRVLPLAEARDKLTQSIHIKLKTEGLHNKMIDRVYKLCTKHKGDCQLLLHISSKKTGDCTILSQKIHVGATRTFLKSLAKIVGEENVWLSRKQY